VDIPYSVEPRPDTGVTNATLGMWLFIASEVMLFGSLFSSYALLRTGAASWPDQGAILNIPLASTNTLVLLASSAAMIVASRALAAGRFDSFRRAFGMVILLGVVFLGIKGVEYADEIGRGLRPATNNFMGLYFTLTGLHALHVAGGLLVNAWLLTSAPREWTARPAQLANRVRAAAMYWTFVDVVWLVMFVTLYLL
jgi:heme/copper-type cytochrome/quinol oxidase subunit 3